MANPEFFKKVFDELAQDDCIGDPNGKLAYAYVRVSSTDQAEEGRSGLPRQVRHVHEIALEQHLKIPWDMVYADDYTGFEFRNRPRLTVLRREYASPQRRASYVVIEHIDRLSRNADWHQGYLLDEMKQYGVDTVFWKPFSGRVERAVMGAVAQDAMEQAQGRMYAGKIEKARDGRVTSHSTPAFGYRLVDSKGREGAAAKKDSHYAICGPEAKIVRYIFEEVGLRGATLRQVAHYLQATCPPPIRAATWRHGAIRRIIRNPVYKGEFAAFRMKAVTIARPTKDGLGTELIKTRVERSPEEWITVAVPAIVSAELWELANEVLRKNQVTSSRNGKREYLLTGLLRCAQCGLGFSGWSKKRKRNGKIYDNPAYRCNSKVQDRYFREHLHCSASVISCRVLDDAVWSVVCSLLLEPERLISILESEYRGERNVQHETQATYLQAQLEERRLEDEKLYRAYMAGVFDEQEYAERRKLLKEQRQRLEKELKAITRMILTRVQFEEQKQRILAISANVRETGLILEAPFAVKKQILKMVVDQIVLDTHEGWFRIEGALPGFYRIDEVTNDSIVIPHSAVAIRSPSLA